MKIHGIIAIAVTALDQIIKGYVRRIPWGKVFFEVNGLFSLEHCVNTGAAFSMLSGHTMLLAVVSLMLLAVIVVYVTKRMRLTMPARVAMECLIGGGLGNLWDRLFHSGVTDYIRLQFIDFPVFNLADMAITASIAVLLILLFTDALEETVEDKHGSGA